MFRTISIAALAVLFSSATPFDARAETVPTKVGQCVKTRVAKLGTRLEGVPGSGTSIEFTNGIYLVSYDTVPQAEESRSGDRVKMCLESIPKDCPPNDERGKVYSVTNTRTKKKFTLPDSQHRCGGA